MCNKDIIGLHWVWASDFLVDADYCFQFQTTIAFHFFYRLVKFLPFLDLNCINMAQMYYEIH